MTAALRTRADPVDLIPGSLEALYSDADDLDAAKARLREAELTVRHQVIASWFGGAATGWHERRRTIADTLSGVGEVYGVVAEVLRAHADVLAWAREQAAVAVELWEAADREAWTDGVQCYEPQTQGLVLTRPGLSGASRTTATPYGHAAAPDPGAATRALAVQVLEDARSQVLLSNQAAAEVLDELSAGLPDGRWHTGSFLAGLWDWVVGVVTVVAKFNQYRAVFDYDGVLADGAEMRAQLQSTGQFLAQNPDETAGVLFDSQGLRDDPARWWGAAAPDIALTVAGGVGALSRGRIAATRLRLARSVVVRPEVQPEHGMAGLLSHESAGLTGPVDWRLRTADLPRGSNRGVRLASGEKELRSIFDDVTRGARPVASASDKIAEAFMLEDGTRIQWRIASRSGGATIDIFGETELKIHVSTT